MKDSLYDFGKQNKKDNSREQKKEKDIKDLYNKYKDFSKEELTNEFISNSKQKLKEGSLSRETIKNTASSLYPYLNEKQKNYLDNLLSKLDE